MGLRIVGGFLVARFTDPAILGLFNGLGLVLSYTPFLLLGLPNGMNRELPYYYGKGDATKAKELAATAQTWALLVSSVVAASLLGLAGYYAIKGDWLLSAGWTVQACGAFFILYGQFYLEMTFRTQSDFVKISIIQVIQQTIGLCSVALVWVADFLGLCARAMLMGFSYLGLLWYWRPLRVRPQWNWFNFQHLIKVGMPIFVVGQMNLWWGASISTAILFLMGTRSLGIYQVASIVNATIVTLTNSAAQVTYPRMVEAYGKGARLSQVLGIPQKAILVSILIGIPAVALGWILMPAAIEFLLPKYTGGIHAAQWTLLAALAFCLLPVMNAFNVIGRQGLYAFTTTVGIVVNLASLFWLGQNGFELEMFAQSFVLGKFASFALGILILFYLAKSEPPPLQMEAAP